MIPSLRHDTYVYCPMCKLTWTMSHHGRHDRKKKYYHAYSEPKHEGLKSEICPKCLKAKSEAE